MRTMSGGQSVETTAFMIKPSWESCLDPVQVLLYYLVRVDPEV